MEKELFDWEGWDVMDTMCFVFYDCTLKKDIGSFKAGDKVGSIGVNYFDSVLEVYNAAGERVCECKLQLSIVE